jgi:16S rRNA G1207 methylase RsmC
LADFRAQRTITLPAPLAEAGAVAVLVPRPWVTYPGLFNGGQLDGMTSALLAALAAHVATQPHAPGRGAACFRVLDFASGSGAIAAALAQGHAPGRSAARRRRGLPRRVRVHLLEADSVAMAAAAENCASAVSQRKHRALQDGWGASSEAAGPHHPHRQKFDWIVSNPPVHAGLPDDLRLLAHLCRGAPARLKPGGTLWVVSQAQVPVGRLLAAATAAATAAPNEQQCGGGFESICATFSTCRRFLVWRATIAAAAAPVGSKTT